VVFELSAVSVFVLSLARTSAWVGSSPLFSTRGIASVGRLALAIGLALVAVPIGIGGPAPPTDLYLFIAVLLGQIALGLLLGWITGLALAIFESAGAFLDLTSGFSMSSLLDPSTGNQNAVIGRIFSLAFVALFFVTDAHLAVVGGFVRSFEASPATVLPLLGSDSVAMAAISLSDMMLVALEIAAPLLGALLLAEVALALMARFVPQANVFMIGLPLKMGLAIGLLGTTLVTFPVYAERIVDRIVQLMDGVSA
jgi:flagellar biosynthesis protein FliR